MNDSDYFVAFNILDSGYRNWWLPAMMLGAIPIGIVIVSLYLGKCRCETAKPGKRDFLKRIRTISIALGGFIVVCALVVFLATFGDYWNCSRSLASSKASYIAGTIDNFMPMPSNGHGVESFTVGGVGFSYSDFVVQAGFNTTTYKGGPIRQGLPVRIWYVGNEIVKLEIKK